MVEKRRFNCYHTNKGLVCVQLKAQESDALHFSGKREMMSRFGIPSYMELSGPAFFDRWRLWRIMAAKRADTKIMTQEQFNYDFLIH